MASRSRGSWIWPVTWSAPTSSRTALVLSGWAPAAAGTRVSTARQHATTVATRATRRRISVVRTGQLGLLLP
jgi:hypothetical protein